MTTTRGTGATSLSERRRLTTERDEVVTRDSQTLEGLSSAIVKLSQKVDDDRRDRAALKDYVRTECAKLRDALSGAHKRVDDFAELWASQRAEMAQARSQAGEELKIAGRTARDIKEQAAAMQLVHDNTPRPEEFLRGVRLDIATLKDEFRDLKGNVDRRFEALPRVKPRPVEERGEGPSVGTKLTR